MWILLAVALVLLFVYSIFIHEQIIDNNKLNSYTKTMSIAGSTALFTIIIMIAHKISVSGF